MKAAFWLSLILWASAVSAVAQEPKKPDTDAKAAESLKEAVKPVDVAEKRQQLRQAEQEVQAAQRTIQKAQRDAQSAQREVERALRDQGPMRKTIQRNFAMQRASGPQAISKVRSNNPENNPIFSVYGLELVEADPVLRSQLALKEDQGLVIVRLAENGLADQAGVKLNDVLIKLNDQAVGKVDQVKEIFAKLGTGAAQADLIRAGKPRHLSLVGPEHGIPLAPITYWIGVPVAPVDAMLRSHLTALPADSGLIATDVIAGSPAAKAGMQKNDILFKFNDKLIANQETLVEEVQKSNGKDSKVELLRRGTWQVLMLKPEPHSAEPQALNALNLNLILDQEIVPGNKSRDLVTDAIARTNLDRKPGSPGQPWTPDGYNTVYYPNRASETMFYTLPKLDTQLEQEMKALTGQIEELRKAIDELKKSLSAGKDPKVGMRSSQQFSFPIAAFW